MPDELKPEVPMAAQFVPAHPANYHTRAGRTDYDRIIIHCTDGRSRASRVAEMFAKLDPDPRRHTSAHFVVDQDGTIIQCVALRHAANHAHDMNSRSVGIEHCARTPKEFGPSDPGLPPSSVQYEASARLVAWLLVAAGLAPTRRFVVGHAESDKKTAHDRCPEGCGWQWDLFMSLVREEHAKLLSETPPSPPAVA